MNNEVLKHQNMLEQSIYSLFCKRFPQTSGCISKLSSYTEYAAAIWPQAPPTHSHYLMHFTLHAL